MDAQKLFLADHAHIHAASTTEVGGPSLEDGLCEGLTPEQLKVRPEGLNSIAWILWHMTRFEDVVVNIVLRGELQVLDRHGWVEKLGIDSRVIGTGSSDEEVGEFSQNVDPLAVRAYRAAVGRETRLWAAHADFSLLDTVPPVAARLAAAPGTIGERAKWVQALWESRTGHGLLSLPVLGHSYIHIGEARVTRSRLGAPVR